MPSPDTNPYITATLASANSTLDLSGKQPFTLSITLTLHASAPILSYTDLHSTFFLPRNALTSLGIMFRNHHTKEEVKTVHIDSCRTPGFARRLTEISRLYLDPEKPVVFEVPFTINSEKESEEGDFDSWFEAVTSGFEDGGVYEATLPLYRTLDWWRYATLSDFHSISTTSTNPSILTRIKCSVNTLVGWWTRDTETEKKYGVPVLPREQQLPIYVEGEGVVFSCVGEKMVWPDELLEKQKINKERRDGEEKRKAEEKRLSRESKC